MWVGLLTLSNFFCHMQAVEKAVQLMTELAPNVCGSTIREGYIRAKINSC